MDALADGVVGLPKVGGRHSLRGQIADALRAAMISGRMQPGVVYSAPALAEEFGVSPTPVREAMIDLVKDEMIEAVRNRGFRVLPLSPRDLDELIELRELLEVPAVIGLAGAVPDEAVGLLRALAGEVVAAAEEGDLLRYVDADRRFHAELLALQGNRTLVQMIVQLRNRSRLYGLADLAARSELVAAAQEHGALVDALVGDDAEGAEKIIRRHLAHVRSDWA